MGLAAVLGARPSRWQRTTRSSEGGSGPYGRGELFSLSSFPWGRELARQAPKWLGWENHCREGTTPRTDIGSQKGDVRRTATAQQRASGGGGLAGLLCSGSRECGCPQTGSEGPNLALFCCSPQSPAATLGIGPSLLGFLPLDSGVRGRQAARGGAVGWPPQSCPPLCLDLMLLGTRWQRLKSSLQG